MLGLLDGQRKQQPLDRDVAVAGFLGDLLRGLEDPRRRLGEIDLAGTRAAYLGKRCERPFGCRKCLAGTAAGAFDEAGGKPLLVVEEHFEDVFRGELLVALADRQGLRRLQETAGALGVFLEVHSVVLSRLGIAVRESDPANPSVRRRYPAVSAPISGGPSRR